VPEVNLNLLLRGQFFAETTRCHHDSQVFKLRGMQAMRNALNVRSDLGKPFVGLFDARSGVPSRVRQVFSDSFQHRRHESDTLINIVVYLSVDSGSLLILGLHQFPAYPCKSCLGKLSLGYVDAGPDIASEGTV
jgi:hypothetical protein